MDYLAKVNHGNNKAGRQADQEGSGGRGGSGQPCWQRVVVFCATVAVNNRRETMGLPKRARTDMKRSTYRSCLPAPSLSPAACLSGCPVLWQFYVHGTHVACHNCTSACAVIFIFCNFRCLAHTHKHTQW